MNNRPMIRVGNQMVELHVNGDGDLAIIVNELLRSLNTYKVYRIGKNKKLVSNLIGSYYQIIKPNKIYRFSINSIRRILSIFEQYGYRRDNIDIVIMDNYKPHRMSVKMNKDIVPRDYQIRYINAISGDNAKRSHLVDLNMGYGKALKNGTKVRIPNGWKNIEDFKVGDEVISKDGTTTKVIGVYPQGVVDLYRVWFQDGRYVDCCGEHLWNIHHNSMETVMNTREIINQLDNGVLCQIPMVTPENYSYINCNTNPYLYGNSLSKHIQHENNDIEPELLIDLDNLDYLTIFLNSGSYQQRMELLNGMLMLNKTNNSISDLYVNVPNRVLRGYTESLVYSLGGVCNSIYDILTSTTTLKISIGGNLNTMSILNITQLVKGDATCIAVEHPSKLFVCENYIVTHNSLIGSYAIAKNGMSVAILTKPSYLEKWVDDINKYMVLEPEDIYMLQGKSSVVNLIEASRRERKYKFYIMSLRTMQNYIEEYKENPKSVPIPPQQLLEHLKIGTILNDESHQEFNALFKSIIMLDPIRLIGLSATMVSDDKKMNYMYNLLFPIEHRASKLVEYVKYIHVISKRYKITNTRLTYKTHMGYNHIKFEQSIMKSSKALHDYIEMVIDTIKDEYIDRRKDGEKCLIFFATIDMCTIATKYISNRYKKLKVSKYTQEDPYEDLLNSDISISTNKSAGTAVDIPNLITVIQTVSISSTQANKQAAGRLREHPTETRYISLSSESIKDHINMEDKRRRSLTGVYKTYRVVWYNKIIGKI